MAIDLEGVMVELSAAIGQITGLPVFDHPPAKVAKVPAAIVSYPSTIMYNAGGDSRLDRMTVGVVVVVSRKVDRVAHTQLGGFASGAGSSSIRERLEDKEDWILIEGVSVKSAEFDVIEIAGTEYLAVIITVDILG